MVTLYLAIDDHVAPFDVLDLLRVHRPYDQPGQLPRRFGQVNLYVRPAHNFKTL